MGNPTLAQIWKQARAQLNDVAASKYTDQVLLPFTQDAVGELEDALLENGAETLGEASTDLAITAGVGIAEIRYTGTTPTLPSDLIEPRSILERAVGATYSKLVPMTSVRLLPIRDNASTIGEYVWEEQAIKFLLPTVDRNIRILYLKGFPPLTDPADPNQEIPYNESRLFLSYKTSALAAELVAQNRDRAIVLHQQAEVALARTLNIRARAQQDLPSRRRTWRRPSRRYGFRSISRIR